MDPDPVVRLMFHVQPRARRTEVVGWHGDAIKVRVAAPPLGGKANARLIEFLSVRLDLPGTAVTLVGGATSRRKRIRISGMDEEEILRRLGLKA